MVLISAASATDTAGEEGRGGGRNGGKGSRPNAANIPVQPQASVEWTSSRGGHAPIDNTSSCHCREDIGGFSREAAIAAHRPARGDTIVFENGRGSLSVVLMMRKRGDGVWAHPTHTWPKI